jgi:hypothetical protein
MFKEMAIQVLDKLMSDYSYDMKIPYLCGRLQAKLNSYQRVQALRRHLIRQHIPHPHIKREFHEYFYRRRIVDGVSVREWRNDDDELHCDLTDKNGVLLPAQIFDDGTRAWFRNNIPCSAGIDKNGQSYPMKVKGNGSKFWLDANSNYHRDEYDVDGNLLPAIVHKHGKSHFYKQGFRIDPKKKVDTYTVEYDLLPRSNDIEFRESCNVSIINDDITLDFKYGGEIKYVFDGMLQKIRFLDNDEEFLVIAPISEGITLKISSVARLLITNQTNIVVKSKNGKLVVLDVKNFTIQTINVINSITSIKCSAPAVLNAH